MQGIVLLLIPCFMTSSPIMFFILYILSEYVWEKPNELEELQDSNPLGLLLENYKMRELIQNLIPTGDW